MDSGSRGGARPGRHPAGQAAAPIEAESGAVPGSYPDQPEADLEREHRSAAGRSGSRRQNSERQNSERRGSQRRTSERPSPEQQTPEQQARDIVYRLLATRARSRAELTQALLRKEIPEEVAEATLQKFVDARLVDDAAFAHSWVQERHHNQGLGRTALKVELRRKGVADEVAAEALSTVDGDAEVERARELVQRKLRTTRGADRNARMRRLVGMLARKGYSEGLAFRVVREELESSGFESDAEHPDEPGDGFP